MIRYITVAMFVFSQKVVNRSLTGIGVSVRAALDHARSEIGINEPITIESILRTLMRVEVAKTTTFGEYKAVILKVTGTASITVQHEFYFDLNDDLREGFIFR